MAVQFCQRDVSQQTTRYGPRFLSAWGCKSHSVVFWGADWRKFCHPSRQIVLPFGLKVSFQL